MGYTTRFTRSWTITPPLSPAMKEFLTKLANTRRMKRRLPETIYGVEGEYFVDGVGHRGQDDDDTVLDSNTAPSTQPGLWCSWVPSKDGKKLQWDGSEKFYDYIPWVQYLIQHILAPNGYVLNGTVKWKGEDRKDTGRIHIVNNVLS